MPTHPALTRLEAYLGSRYAETTVRDTLGQSAAFLQAVGTRQPTREDLLRYMDGMVSRGYKLRSIHTILGRLKTLHYANGWPWPLLPRDMHLNIADPDTGGPALAPDEVRRLILGARELGFPDAPAVALASIYGLRPNEIASTLSGGCDGQLLRVQTSKHGRLREHGIPPAIAQVLTFRGRERTTAGLHKCFERLMRGHVRDPREGEGFHSVRRSVVTGLLNAGVAEFRIQHWMGWQVKRDMVARYFRPQREDLDAEVFGRHPFLGYWVALA